MKKPLSLIFLFSFLISFSQNETNTTEIWDNYLSTISDKEVINNIKTYYRENIMTTKFGEIKTISRIKYPNKVYRETFLPNGVRTIHIFNGINGSVKIDGEIKQMNETEIEDFKDLALIFPDFYYSHAKGNISIKETTNDYYKIKVKSNSGNITYYLVDKRSFELKNIISTDFDLQPIEFQTIDKIKTMKFGLMIIGKDTLTIKNLKTEYNIEISDNIFK